MELDHADRVPSELVVIAETVATPSYFTRVTTAGAVAAETSEKSINFQSLT
jgi:hypothetical protein